MLGRLLVEGRHVLCGLAVFLAGVSYGCGIPKDPVDTLEKVRGGTMRVGVMENAPWVILSGSEPEGVEVDLVVQFAGQVGASRIEWVQGNEDELMEALKEFELDLVIGGITQATLWKNQVGLTRPYLQSKIIVGTSGTPPADLKGVEIAVEPPSMAAARLKEKGAVPVRVADLDSVRGPVAAPEWHIEKLGLTPTSFELSKEQHVMAVPPGENRWLIHLERFLTTREPTVERMLEEVPL